jgi:hypothetical protein
MIYAVMEPTIHIQILSSAIRFVQVRVMHRENVAVLQIGKPAVVAPVQSFRSPAFRNFVPNERVAVIVAFPIAVHTKQRMRWVVVRNHRHDRAKFACCSGHVKYQN